MTTKIISFEAENVKRIKAVELHPEQNGLTVIGGKNGEGKTSVLDSIAWALGGNKFKPTNAKREGAMAEPYLRVALNNGLVVERKGANSDLKVIDASGQKAGQKLLDSFLDELALNLPKFMNMSDKDKAEKLLEIIGVGSQLYEYDKAIEDLYNKRTFCGREEAQKRGAANELPYWQDAPKEQIDISELLKEQQEIITTNKENQEKRAQANLAQEKALHAELEVRQIEAQLKELQEKLIEKTNAFKTASKNSRTLSKAANALIDLDISEVNKQLNEADSINSKVRDNTRSIAAFLEADDLKEKYQEYTGEIEALRDERKKLLENAQLPLPELGIEEGKLTYKGKYWDCMSGSERMKVATAIVRKLNPKCGFVLVDELEQFDTDTLAELAQWAKAEKLQIIGTRVSTGDECSLWIVDGISETKKQDAAATEWSF